MFLFFRQHQRSLMLLIAVLTIIAFIWLYNQTNSTPFGVDQVGSIYGKVLRTMDVDRGARMFRVAFMLGQIDLVTTLGGRSQEEGEVVSNFIWNTYVLRHEANKLGVIPTNAQIEAAIKAIPALQRDGHFDPELFRMFLAERLAPMGLTSADMEEVIRDSIRLEGLRAIITSPISSSSVESDFLLRVFQPVTGSVIRFNLDTFLAKSEISEEDIQKFFDENKDHFHTEEMRIVELVRFTLSDQDAALKGREKVDALQVQANTASDFAEKVEKADADFRQVAKEFQREVTESPAFTIDGKTDVTSDHRELPAIAEAVFRLNDASPSTGVLQFEDTFYVAHLTKVIPSRPLTFEEARDRITKGLQSEAAQKALDASAKETREKMMAAMAEGKSFAQATEEFGVVTEPLEGIIPESAGGTPDERGIAAATLLLNEGQLSGFETAPWGGFLVYLKNRAPLSEEIKKEKLADMTAQLNDQKNVLIFSEWLRQAREAAHIRIFARTQ